MPLTSSPVEPPNDGSSSEILILRQVPVAVLRPRIDLCTPTREALNPGSRVLVVGDAGKAGDVLVRRLQTRRVQAVLIQPGPLVEIEKEVSEALAGSPVQGVYFLPGLDVEGPISGMTTEIWQSELEKRIFSLYTVMRALPEGAFLVCGTRCDGLHGFSQPGAAAPMGGLVSGFAKALARERPAALVKVVDFEVNVSDSLIASRLIEETLRDPAVVEVGWEGDHRFTIILNGKSAPENSGLLLDENSIFLVSGGTAGIAAPIIIHLAEATHGCFYLLGRSAPPLDTLAAVEKVGGKAVFLPCDVTDTQAVQATVRKVKVLASRVDILIHAAAFENSRRLNDKPLDEFARTLAVKAGGFFNLFHALWEENCMPRAVVAFSSVAARFGNIGQTDYCAANDLLCRLISALRNQHPQVRALAIDWGLWAEVGMASRGRIPRLMQMAGVDMLKPEDAAPLVLGELQAGTRGEVVLSGSLGILMKQRFPDGGLDIPRANAALIEGKPTHSMFSQITRLDLNEGVILEADLDPQVEPFLKDHTLNGIPLLPGVMGIEGFSVAARHVASVLGSSRGNFQVTGLENIRFLAPLKFYRNQVQHVTWKTQVEHEAGGLAARVTLESKPATHSRPAEKLLHFSGKVCLLPSDEPLEKSLVKPPHWDDALYCLSASDIYKLFSHGPSFQVLESVQWNGERLLGRLFPELPPLNESNKPFLTRPALVELCLQTAGTWEVGKTGQVRLPMSIASLTLYQVRTNGVPVFAEVKPFEDRRGCYCFDARVVDGRGHVYLEMKDYRSTALPYPPEIELLAPFEKLVSQIQG